jgi:hypothetical protein
VREVLLARQNFALRSFPASFPGRCFRCSNPVLIGEPIVTVTTDGYGRIYLAECCADYS